MTVTRHPQKMIISCKDYNLLLHPQRNYDIPYVPPDPILANKYIRIGDNLSIILPALSNLPALSILPPHESHYILKRQLAMIKSKNLQRNTSDAKLTPSEVQEKIWQRNNKTASAHTSDIAVKSMNCGHGSGGVMNDGNLRTTVGVKHQSYIARLAELKRR